MSTEKRSDICIGGAWTSTITSSKAGEVSLRRYMRAEGMLSKKRNCGNYRRLLARIASGHYAVPWWHR